MKKSRFSEEQIIAILAEGEAGANISEVARRNGLSPQQLFAWRREVRLLFAEENGTAMPAEVPPSRAGKARAKPSPDIADETPQFVPVVMTAAAPSSPPSGRPTPPASSAGIEIAIGDVVVRVSGAVEALALEAVLAAVRRAS